jgi:biopolymer transport protein ExbD
MSRNKRPRLEQLDVDMVPFIDIVTLLLMFLIIVGDMTKSAAGVKMLLPRADQALIEKQIPTLDTEGRIVVQVRKDDRGKYCAVVQGVPYGLVPEGNDANLLQYLDAQVSQYRIRKGKEAETPDGGVRLPVKLRVPGEAPMPVVERAMTTLAKAGLVNIHYAAAKPDEKKIASR